MGQRIDKLIWQSDVNNVLEKLRGVVGEENYIARAALTAVEMHVLRMPPSTRVREEKRRGEK